MEMYNMDIKLLFISFYENIDVYEEISKKVALISIPKC